MTSVVRFWSHVAFSDLSQCWHWNGSTFKFGHGKFWHDGKNRQAHRIAWMFTYGEMPELCVLHRCDNPPCCNPSHLFLGTQIENMADRDKKGRQARGERNRHARLTEIQVSEIKKLAASGIRSRELAIRYGVKAGSVAGIVAGRVWAHVKEME